MDVTQLTPEQKAGAISVRPTPGGAGDASGPGALDALPDYQPPAPATDVGASTIGAPVTGGAPTTGGIDQLPDYQPPAQPKPTRQQSAGESTARGVLNSLTFGFAPDIAGLAEASGMPSTAADGQPTKENEIDINPIRPIVGAAKLLHSWLSEHPDPTVVEAYNKGRESYGEEQKNAEQQHFGPYLAGQLTAALAVPLGGAAKAATTLGRVAKVGLSGGFGGGLYEAGTKSGEGADLADTAKAAAKGAVTGAAFGTVGGTVAEAVNKGVKKAASIYRGRGDASAEAAHRVTQAADADRLLPRPYGATEVKVTREAGVPHHVADLGEHTRTLARSAADTSPAAEHKLGEVASQRFDSQSQRVSDWIRSKIGGRDTEGVIESLKAAARKANSPKYRRAHAVADAKYPGGMWSPELERLMGSDAMQQAVQQAVKRGSNRAVAEGMGAFNPKVTFNNGILKIDKGKGILAYPDLKFWDVVHRELADSVNKGFKDAEKGNASAMSDLHRALLKELDSMVPEFGAARSTAAKFFGATDAAEAGAKFVTENVNLAAAGRELAKMSDAERQLFRISFMSELADKVSRVRDRTNVINQAFVDSPAAKGKIALAIGPKEAREFEALLRVETEVDKLRARLGGSMTSRNVQHLAHGAGGATAVGLFEMAKEGDIDPKSIFFGAILVGGVRGAAHRLDARVAEKVADMLISKDPTIFAKGIATVAREPKLLDALRATANASARVGAHDVGPDAAASGALTGAHNLMGGKSEHHGHHSDNFDPIASQAGANQ